MSQLAIGPYVVSRADRGWCLVVVVDVVTRLTRSSRLLVTADRRQYLRRRRGRRTDVISWQHGRPAPPWSSPRPAHRVRDSQPLSAVDSAFATSRSTRSGRQVVGATHGLFYHRRWRLTVPSHLHPIYTASTDCIAVLHPTDWLQGLLRRHVYNPCITNVQYVVVISSTSSPR